MYITGVVLWPRMFWVENLSQNIKLSMQSQKARKHRDIGISREVLRLTNQPTTNRPAVLCLGSIQASNLICQTTGWMSGQLGLISFLETSLIVDFVMSIIGFGSTSQLLGTTDFGTVSLNNRAFWAQRFEPQPLVYRFLLSGGALTFPSRISCLLMCVTLPSFSLVFSAPKWLKMLQNSKTYGLQE